jgi:hypothetical protein
MFNFVNLFKVEVYNQLLSNSNYLLIKIVLDLQSSIPIVIFEGYSLQAKGLKTESLVYYSPR